MPLNYNPKDASGAWPEGDYVAVLAKVEDAISKTSGQPMQVWHIECHNEAGKTRTIREYVTASTAGKIKALARAVDQLAAFNAGEFQADDHVGANFRVELKVEDSEQYGPQNKIQGLRPLSSNPASQSAAPKPQGQSPDDSLKREKIAAWVKWKKSKPGVADETLANELREVIALVFKRTPETLTALQWKKLADTNFAVPAPAVAEGSEFADDDIPF